MSATIIPLRPDAAPSPQRLEEARALRTVSEVMRTAAASLPRRSNIGRGLAEYSTALADKALELALPAAREEA